MTPRVMSWSNDSAPSTTRSPSTRPTRTRVPYRGPGPRSAPLMCSDYSATRNTRLSARQSNRRLRNKVHSELSALLDGGQLAVAPQAVRDYLVDTRVADVAQQYRAQRPDAPTDG